MPRYLKSFAVGALALVTLTECGNFATEADGTNLIDNKQHAIFTEIKQGVDLINGVLDIGKKLMDLINSGRQDEELKQIVSKLDAIDSSVKNVEKIVTDLSYWTSVLEQNLKISQVDSLRLDVRSAITNHNDRKELGLPSNFDETILRDADQLTSSALYSLPGRTAGSPTRFEYRLSTPSFIFAVDSWFGVRASTGKPWTDAVKTTVRRWADHLDFIGGNIKSQIRCERDQTDRSEWDCDDRYTSPAGRPPPCHYYYACEVYIFCTDNIQGGRYLESYKWELTSCDTGIDYDDAWTQKKISEYNPQTLIDRAARWRSMIP